MPITASHRRSAGRVLGLLLALSSVALAQPSVTVNPETGPPSEKVIVGGTGFGADEAVDLYFDTADLALAATGPGGRFTGIGLTVPSSAASGAHWVTGIGRQSGLAAQIMFIVQTDWPQFHRGPQHHGDNPTENILSVSNVGGIEVRWKSGNGYVIESSPAVARGTVYIGSSDSTLYAFNSATGQTVWSAATGGSILSSPAVVDGSVYVGSADGKVYAFQAANGHEIWSADAGSVTGSGVISSPAVANGMVYVGSLDSHLYAFNAATGHLMWSAATGATIYSSPAVGEGLVYVQSDKLYAFDAVSGVLSWSAAPGNFNYHCAPTVENGVVYAGAWDNMLRAFDGATGQQIWSAAIGQLSDFPASPAVANGVVYTASNDGHVYALDASTGRLSGALQ